MQADEGSELIIGFNREVNRELYLKHLNDKKLDAILNKEPVKKGDVFFLPARRLHAIGPGILLAEIQQTSDITYRIYDFDRKDASGKSRELHTELAVDSIDYSHHKSYRTEYAEAINQPSRIISCRYFTTNKLRLNRSLARNIIQLDCFVIYMCLEGACSVNSAGNDSVRLNMGETVLVPASLINYTLQPDPEATLLEVYIDNQS